MTRSSARVGPLTDDAFQQWRPDDGDYGRHSIGVPFLALIALSFVHVNAFATIYLTDGVMFLASLVYVSRRNRQPLPKTIRVIAVFSLGIALSSLLQAAILAPAISASAVAKGVGVGVFFAGDVLISTAYLMSGSWLRRSRALLVAFGLSQLFGFFIDPVAVARSTAWKFGIATPITLFAAAWSTRQTPEGVKVRPTARILFLSLAIINFLLQFRSMSMFCLVAAAIFSPTFKDRPLAATGKRVFLTLAVAGVAVMAAVTVTAIYASVANSGYLGLAAQVKGQEQGTTAIGALVGSRPEVWFLLPTIREHPIIGSGANAELSERAYESGVRTLTRLGASDPAAAAQPSEPVPVHSHLFGSWALYGLPGLLLWVAVLVLIFRSLSMAISSARWPVLILPAVILSWDVLFSPFGAARRVEDAIYIAVLCTGMRAIALGGEAWRGNG